MSFLVREELIGEIMIFCTVKPLQRPRINTRTYQIYQPKENQKELFYELKLYKRDEPVERPITIDTLICFKSDGKSGWPTQKHYGDEDNLRKAINDALQSCGVISDDKYVIGGENVKCFAEDNYCHIKIWEAKIGIEGLSEGSH